MNIAIIGYGSIGQRHARNCLALGHKVEVFSRHEGRKLTRDNYDLVIICSKTSEHILNVGKFKDLAENFLVEKPLAATYKDALAIQKLLSGKTVRIGYCLIFNPIIAKVKQIIDKKTLGDVYFAQIYAGSYLPNWRTGEDYRERYSAKRAEGGGVALDLIHEVNYSQFFFGDQIIDVYALQVKVSHLEIDSNDLAYFAIIQKNRVITITLNYFELPGERYIKLVGSQSTLFADLLKKRIEILGRGGKRIYSKQFDFDYNQMYIDEVVSMVKFITGKEKQREILSVDQAIKDLGIIEGKNE